MVEKKIVVSLASPRGFCAGVERAIETVKMSLAKYGKPVHVLHEIVHNRHVIEELEEMGAVFVEHLTEIPKGGICIFSAHGVSVDVENYAKELCLNTIDATCPLVTSVHRMVEKYHADGNEVLIIGHHNHPEVLGTAGRVSGNVQVVASEKEATEVEVANPDKVGVVTQTTLTKSDINGILSILRKRFPSLLGASSNICFATQNRQDAVKILAQNSQLVLVVGSKNSSNSNRLREVAKKCGVEAYLVDDFSDIDRSWLDGVEKVGITAGASAPERLVSGVISYLEGMAEVEINEMEGVREKIHFPLTVLP